MADYTRTPDPLTVSDTELNVRFYAVGPAGAKSVEYQVDVPSEPTAALSLTDTSALTAGEKTTLVQLLKKLAAARLVDLGYTAA